MNTKTSGPAYPKPAFFRLSVEKRSHLLKTAMTLYRDYPYEDISARLLCQELQLNSATFYRYFDTRDDLLTYMVVELTKREMKWIFDQMQERDGKDAEGITYFPDFQPDHLPCFSDLEYEFALSINRMPDHVQHDLIFATADAVMAYYTDILKKERQEGRLRPEVDIELIAYMYATTGYNLLRYCNERGLSNEEYLKKKVYLYYDFFYRGILNEPAQDAAIRGGNRGRE